MKGEITGIQAIIRGFTHNYTPKNWKTEKKMETFLETQFSKTESGRHKLYEETNC